MQYFRKIILYLNPILLLAISVLLIYLSLPGGPFPLLVWIAFAPLAIALAKMKGTSSKILGTIYSFLIWYVSSWWIAIGIENIGQVSLVRALMLSVLPAICGSIPYVIFCWTASRYKLFSSESRPFLAALIFTLLIVCIPNFFPGNIAHALYQYRILIQVCDLGGVTLLLFLVNYFNFLGADVFLRERFDRRAFGSASRAVMLLGIVLIYGNLQLGRWENFMRDSPKVRIGLVQPNIPILKDNKALFVTEADRGNNLTSMIELTRTLAAKDAGIDLFVWPEVPFSFSMEKHSNSLKLINDLVRTIGKPLLASSLFIERARPEASLSTYNAIFFLKNAEEEAQVYLKNYLVPFAEYIPFQELLSFFINKKDSYTAGNRIVNFELNSGVKIGTPICLEAIYSDFVGMFIREGAQIIVNPSDDAYFGFSRGSSAHLALTTFRAVEYRTPLVRVTNSGISEIIDQSGSHLIQDTELFKVKAQAQDVSISDRQIKINPNIVGISLCGLMLFLNLIFYNRGKRT